MSTGGLDHMPWLTAFQDDFLATLRDADRTARVPWCGRWRVADLTIHLARIHHWAAAQARRTREVPLGRGPFDDLAGLYERCALELREAILELGPDAIGSTLLGPGPASFWMRRQMNETLVHLWDLRSAVGLRTDVPGEVWADTVDEVVAVMQPRQVRLGRMEPPTVAVDLVGTDSATRHRLGRPDGEADVVVSGPVQQLALLSWRRTAPDDDALTVEGARDRLDALLAERLTP